MLTILSAKYSNADQTAVIAMTEESATVLITQSPGKAEKWAALQDWIARGGAVAPFVTRAAVKPRELSSELDSLKAALVAKGYISESDIASDAKS
jgi:hypothetical protein